MDFDPTIELPFIRAKQHPAAYQTDIPKVPGQACHRTQTSMSIVTQAQKQQCAEDGYFLLESVIPEHHLELLRGECQAFIDEADAQMDKAGTDVVGLNHRNSRYFLSNCFREQPRLHEFLFSELMAQICQATLGNDVYLFWEQYVVKGAEAGIEFSWHQDSGYIGFPDHKPAPPEPPFLTGIEISTNWEPKTSPWNRLQSAFARRCWRCDDVGKVSTLPNINRLPQTVA